MTKGLGFLKQKKFDPKNPQFQRRKFEALQKEAQKQRNVKEREQELAHQKELNETRKMLTKKSIGSASKEYQMELKKEQIAFIYDVPPGLKKQIEKERNQIEEEQRLNEWNDVISNMSPNERRFAEKEIERGLSVHERNCRRFEFLKNAPMVGDYVQNMKVTHKPFGKIIRNVRCVKCGTWGHNIGDRECVTKININKKEKEMIKDDPLCKMKSKLLNKKVKQCDYIDINESDLNMKKYEIKPFEFNDGTAFKLVKERKITKKKNRKRKYVDEEDNILMLSLDKDKQIESLNAIEKRESKRRKCKKKKKCRNHSEKHRKRSRSRSKSIHRHKHKSRSLSTRF